MEQKADPEEYRRILLNDLDETYSVVAQTKYLSQIFDESWRNRIHRHIEQADLTEGNPFSNASAQMFFELNHWFRGNNLFEQAQQLVAEGRPDELSETQAFLCEFGSDPLKNFLPLLEQRLEALFSLTSVQSKTKIKMSDLRRYRYEPRFSEHMLEASVLGFFAQQEILKDIDVPLIGNNSHQSTVDGLIKIGERPIYVEITYSNIKLFSAQPGIHAGDFQKAISIVIEKIFEKVAKAKQLALLEKQPGLLVISSTSQGVDKTVAQCGAVACFADPKYRKLSAIVFSDTWKFINTQFYLGNDPETSLTTDEVNWLENYLPKA